MKNLLIIIILLVLTGCQQDLGGGVVTKELNLAGEKVLIGGEPLLGAGEASLADFKPEAKLEKWGQETYLKVWSEEKGDKTATQENDKIVWNAESGNEYNFYTKDHDGTEAFEYEIIFKEKPKSNIVTLKIETKDLEFYYQPELTQAEIDEGAFRPDDVIGSYAVYHATKRNHILGQTDYKTGKAFHIYRPKIMDAEGKEVWGEFNTDVQATGNLTITIPQDFLDKAVYPVVVDPTFGVTTVGASSGGWSSDGWRGEKATTTSSGTVISISVYAYSAEGNDEIKGTLVNNSLDIVTNGIADSTGFIGAAGWYTSTFATPPSITVSTAYWASGIHDTDAAQANGYYDTVSGDGTHARDITNSFSSPANPTDADVARTTKFSIYATYTEPATSTASIKPSVIYFE